MDSRKTIKIVVLEDSNFYNKMLTRQLEIYTNEIALDKGFDFKISSFTSVEDCLINIDDDTDILFLDYYLSDGFRGIDILQRVKEKCKHCEIVVMSQNKSVETAANTLAEGASRFIYKDNNALPRSCFFVEDIINQRYPAA